MPIRHLNTFHSWLDLVVIATTSLPAAQMDATSPLAFRKNVAATCCMHDACCVILYHVAIETLKL
jgi:hypothetical protein